MLSLRVSVTRFERYLVTNFRTKVAQIFGNFLDYFKHLFINKTLVATFGQRLENIGQHFVSISAHSGRRNTSSERIFNLSICLIYAHE